MKASDLLYGVVEDARNLDRDIYLPDYTVWHRCDEEQKDCSICFAGVYLTRFFEPNQSVQFHEQNPSPVTEEQRATCEFLDRIREGSFGCIHRYAAAAGIDNPISLGLELKELYENTPALKEVDQLPDGNITLENRSFYDWETFDAFLDHAEKLAGLLAAGGY